MLLVNCESQKSVSGKLEISIIKASATKAWVTSIYSSEGIQEVHDRLSRLTSGHVSLSDTVRVVSNHVHRNYYTQNRRGLQSCEKYSGLLSAILTVVLTVDMATTYHSQIARFVSFSIFTKC